MIPKQQVQLRWSTHQGTVITNFDTLLKSESFVDVTLMAEGKQLKAHKILLSACSSYFEEIFIQMQTDKYPIVFLKDVKFTELQALLHFMYHGEVKISQEELPSLLSVAKSLRIRGLSSDQPTPTIASASKPIPLLINNGNQIQTTNPIPISQPIILNNNQQFVSSNTSRETPIQIVNCNSLAAKSRPPPFPILVHTPPVDTTPLRPQINIKNRLANSKSTLSSAPLQIPLPMISAPVRDRFILPNATPVTAAGNHPASKHRPIAPKGLILISPPAPAENIKRRPNILKAKPNLMPGIVTTLATRPVRKSVDGPPILFPEVELHEDNDDSNPKYEFVSARNNKMGAGIEMEEEEIETMANGSDNSETSSPPDLSQSSFSYVEPRKFVDMNLVQFTVPGSAIPKSKPSTSKSQVTKGPEGSPTKRQMLLKRKKLAGKLMHQCKTCLKLYERKGSLIRHEKYECSNPPQFQCGFCGLQMRHTFHKNIHEKTCKRRHSSRRGFAIPRTIAVRK